MKKPIVYFSLKRGGGQSCTHPYTNGFRCGVPPEYILTVLHEDTEVSYPLCKMHARKYLGPEPSEPLSPLWQVPASVKPITFHTWVMRCINNYASNVRGQRYIIDLEDGGTALVPVLVVGLEE